MKDFPLDVVQFILILQLPYIFGKFSAVLGFNESGNEVMCSYNRNTYFYTETKISKAFKIDQTKSSVLRRCHNFIKSSHVCLMLNDKVLIVLT